MGGRRLHLDRARGRRLRPAASTAALALALALVGASVSRADDGASPPKPPPKEEPKAGRPDGGAAAAGAKEDEGGAESAAAERLLRPMARGFAALLRAYLEDRGDPAKAKVWDEVLRDFASDLEALPSGSAEAGAGNLLGRMVARAAQSLNDPARRAIWARVVGQFLKARGAGAGAASPPAAAAEPAPAAATPASDDPLVAGGAHLHLVGRGGGALGLEVQALDAGSVAAPVGLVNGDVIVSAGGTDVSFDTPARLRRDLSRVGELSLAVERQGKRIVFDVEVAPPASSPR